MLTLIDQLARNPLDKLLRSAGRVHPGLVIASQPQEVDLWFEPAPGRDADDPRLGVLGRMVALGPCMLEPFPAAPSVAQVRACVHKQHALDRARACEAGRRGQPPPPFPRLWILSAGQPGAGQSATEGTVAETVIEQFDMHPMAGWPAGFWQRGPADHVHLVVLPDVPRGRDTLLLRLLGRGPTFRAAVRELCALPADAWERQATVPLRLALGARRPGNPLMAAHTRASRRMDVPPARQTQRFGQDDLCQVLIDQLGLCFGPLPDCVVERIRHAGKDQLERWAERVLLARSIEDVLAAP